MGSEKIKICFASNNPKKLEEIRKILPPRFELLSLKDIGCTDELPENTGTIEGNSFQKAEYVWEEFGVNCFADDTGLEVDALNGEPGVDSAFYAGFPRSDEKNVAKLLGNLQGEEIRDARFRTVITLFLEGKYYQFEGVVEGEILTEKEGEGGFGYDPVFRPKGYQKSFAQMDIAEKNRISHRGMATRKLIAFLEAV